MTEFEKDTHFRRLIQQIEIANSLTGIISHKDYPFEYTKFFNVLHKEMEQQLSLLRAIEHRKPPEEGELQFTSLTRTWAEKNILPQFTLGKKAEE